MALLALLVPCAATFAASIVHVKDGLAGPGHSAVYAGARTLRLADGPDEVHRNQIATLEWREHA